MKIGNIVTKQVLKDYSGFNIFERYEDVDNELPTLIIGFREVKSITPEFDVLDRKIDDNTYWTCTVREKREIHTQDLDKFKNKCYQNITKRSTYIYVDPFNRTTKEIKKIINKIKNTENLIVYKDDNMLYLLSDNIIFGINLDVMDFLDINNAKLINKLKTKSSAFLEGQEVLIEYVKDMEYLNNEVMYVPLLYSINNEV